MALAASMSALLLGACSSSPSASTVRPPPSSTRSPVAITLGTEIARGFDEELGMPAGWVASRSVKAGAPTVRLTAPCGPDVVLASGPIPNPRKVATALEFARDEIKSRGTRGGVASEPRPADDLDGSPTVEVDFGRGQRVLVTVRAGRPYTLESVTSVHPCVADLLGVLTAVARSWKWVE